MQKTENYQLNQWDKTDRIQMEDFNADNAKIDAALSVVAKQAAMVSKCGNCQIYYGSYVGKGTGTNTLTFPKKPLFITIMGTNMWLVTVQGAPVSISKNAGTGSGKSYATWSGNSVSLEDGSGYSNYPCNNEGETYYVVALMDAAT